MPQIIEVTILSACGEGEDVFIRIIHLIPTSRIISFKRLQLQVKLSIAMSIYQYEGQIDSDVGIHIEEPSFLP